MGEEFFNDNDLADLFAELDSDSDGMLDQEFDKEMDASSRRYMEIIKKHKDVE